MASLRRIQWTRPAPSLGERMHFRIAVFYDAGGINYATYKTVPRGFHISGNPVEIGDGFEKTKMFQHGSGRMLLLESKRFSDKQLEALAVRIMPRIDDAMPHFLALECFNGLTVLMTGELPALAAEAVQA